MDENYRGPAWWPLAALAGPAPQRVRRYWLLMTAAAVALAALEAVENWSGLPLHIGGVTVGISIYPPLSIALLLAAWIGPAWGMLPAWLATFTSALIAGMAPPTAAVFALATPVEVFLLWSSMVTLNIDPDLPRLSDVRRFLAAGLVAATGSSLGVLIWNEARHVELLEGQRLWQGWLLGDVLQIALVVAPALRCFGRRVRTRLEREIPVPPRRELSYSDSVRRTLVVSATLVGLGAVGLRMLFVSLGIPADALTESGVPLLPRLRELALFAGLLLLVIVLMTSAFSASLARLGDREKSRALHDPLTGCLNRRAFYETFSRE
ncbi:MAG TPA: hypothetical protein PLB02_13565, partial [Thermoanaerobaculia bacterium]|nr:hypothetical protein [Thermoanaerobaculia bacterium]